MLEIDRLSLAKCFGIAVFIIMLGLFIWFADFDSYMRALPFSAEEDAGWLNGKLAYLIFASLLVSIGCPRQLISFFAAYFFGLWMGIVLGVVSTTIACAFSFSIASFFQTSLRGLLKGKLKLAFDFWKENTFFSTMIWRFIPAGSNLLTNLVAGAFGISALPFILGSAVGYVPHTIIFALLGAGVEIGSNTQIIMSNLASAGSARLVRSTGILPPNTMPAAQPPPM